MAIDIESHLRSCPVAERNEGRRVRRWRLRRDAAANDATMAASGESDGSDCSSEEGKKTPPSSPSGGKKRKKKKTSRGRGGESPLRFDPTLDGDEEDEFCTLCEVEKVLGRVHSRSTECSLDGVRAGGGPSLIPAINSDANGRPVVPETFTAGFMSHVAPWFRRGVQEDSHEFLRLLIDAMQNSCKAARTKDDGNSSSNNNNKGPTHVVGDDSERDDVEYPFRLFRGTVESNVTCSACRAVSYKIDPIEDIGLDILPVKKHSSSNPPPSSSSSGRISSYRGANSRSTSPNTHHAHLQPLPLAAVQEALERFTSIEHLDSGYKCEKCGKVGKATKTSKLASIPPILTLHLKRFRYGSLSSADPGVTAHRRGAPRGGGGNGAMEVGPSGSAKIEGHVAFKSILDIKPYLTRELQEGTFKKAFCRLFAVVVHNGKNSHSGHYVAYVNSLSSKEWWKMDDAKVSRASIDEVLGCEAYMLFYRVVDHPVSKSLGELAGKRAAEEKRIRDEMERVIKEAEERARMAEEEERVKAEASANASVSIAAVDATSSSAAEAKHDAHDDISLGKRKRPDLASGEEWAKAMTSLPSSYYPILKQIEDFISENVTFCPDFFTYITQEYHRMLSRVGGKKIKTLLGRGPSGVYPPQDVQEGAQDVRDGILDLFHMISIVFKSNSTKGNGGGSGENSGMFLLPPPEVPAPTLEEEALPAMTVDQELIIPEPGEGFDGYDGAL